MDGSDPNKNAIYGALIGISIAFVVVMSIRHFICMDLRIFPDAPAVAPAAAAAQEEEEEEEEAAAAQQEDPL
jgi:hypothetical protein